MNMNWEENSQEDLQYTSKRIIDIELKECEILEPSIHQLMELEDQQFIREFKQWNSRSTGKETMSIDLLHVYTFSKRLKCEIEGLLFFVDFARLSVDPERFMFRVSVDESNGSLGSWKFALNTNNSLTHQACSVRELLDICLFSYNRHKGLFEDGIQKDQLINMYNSAWSLDESDCIVEILQSGCTILEQFQKLKEMECNNSFYSIRCPNVFVWELKFRNFGSDTLLHSDLTCHKEKFGSSMEIVLQLRFDEKFPKKPPTLRAVRPRLEYLSCNSTFEGLLLLDLLLPENWLPNVNMVDLISKLYYTISENARIDLRTNSSYDSEITLKAIKRRKERVNVAKANNFQRSYKAYSASYAALHFDSNTSGILEGGRILLPASAAEHIFSLPYFVTPLMFELRTSRDLLAYCGVSEFSATEGNVILPDWILTNLHLNEGMEVEITGVCLTKGIYCKVQPHSKSFYSLRSHKALLENALRNFSALSEGNTINIHYNKKQYMLEVIELQPQRAVSIVAEPYLDLKIEFIPAIDLDEQSAKLHTPETRAPQMEKKQNNSSGTDQTLTDGNQCENCKKLIPPIRYQSHVRHCKNNFYYCSVCCMLIKSEEKSIHEKEFHSERSCDQCGLIFEAHLLEDHKSNHCDERIVYCCYCEFPIPAKEVQSHENMCGNYTEQCSHCKSYVTLKYLAEHLTYCGSDHLIRRSDYECPICDFPQLKESELIQHVESCHMDDPEQSICPICDSYVSNLYDHLTTYEGKQHPSDEQPSTP